MITTKSGFDKIFDNPYASFDKFMKLPCIWLDKPIIVQGSKTVRVAQGDYIKANDGKLITCDNNPTHEVISCWGTLQDNWYIMALNLSNNQIEKITQ